MIAYTSLKDMLERLYPTPKAARLLVEESEVDSYVIDFSGSASACWSEIIRKTYQQNKLEYFGGFLVEKNKNLSFLMRDFLKEVESGLSMFEVVFEFQNIEISSDARNSSFHNEDFLEDIPLQLIKLSLDESGFDLNKFDSLLKGEATGIASEALSEHLLKIDNDIFLLEDEKNFLDLEISDIDDELNSLDLKIEGFSNEGSSESNRTAIDGNNSVADMSISDKKIALKEKKLDIEKRVNSFEHKIRFIKEESGKKVQQLNKNIDKSRERDVRAFVKNFLLSKVAKNDSIDEVNLYKNTLIILFAAHLIEFSSLKEIINDASVDSNINDELSDTLNSYDEMVMLNSNRIAEQFLTNSKVADEVVSNNKKTYDNAISILSELPLDFMSTEVSKNREIMDFRGLGISNIEKSISDSLSSSPKKVAKYIKDVENRLSEINTTKIEQREYVNREQLKIEGIQSEIRSSEVLYGNSIFVWALLKKAKESHNLTNESSLSQLVSGLILELERRFGHSFEVFFHENRSPAFTLGKLKEEVENNVISKYFYSLNKLFALPKKIENIKKKFINEKYRKTYFWSLFPLIGVVKAIKRKSHLKEDKSILTSDFYKNSLVEINKSNKISFWVSALYIGISIIVYFPLSLITVVATVVTFLNWNTTKEYLKIDD